MTSTLLTRAVSADHKFALLATGLNVADFDADRLHAIVAEITEIAEGGALGGVLLNTLPAGEHIPLGRDEHPQSNGFERFVVALSGSRDIEIAVDGQTFEPVAGEAWWVNHKRMHAITNYSTEDWRYMVVDVVSPKYRALRGACYARERAPDLWDEIIPLLKEHWREIAFYQDLPLDPDVDAYNAMEEAGGLRCYTLRMCGELIGYAIYFVRRSLHYKSSLQASQDVLFILPQYRNSRYGLRLIEFADNELREEGVQVVYQHVKVTKSIHDFGPLLARIGYTVMDRIHARRLDRC